MIRTSCAGVISIMILTWHFAGMEASPVTEPANQLIATDSAPALAGRMEIVLGDQLHQTAFVADFYAQDRVVDPVHGNALVGDEYLQGLYADSNLQLLAKRGRTFMHLNRIPEGFLSLLAPDALGFGPERYAFKRLEPAILSGIAT